ncbi:MAG: hypothetical protein GX664_08195 [Bacteroidales bacterium]|nr:hypothetical protein [Proteiniphilum sp.]NLD22430.1 hypothetical protein [Bacteroidales bacterium]
MVHRVEAACAMNKQKAHVAYIGFDLTEKDRIYYSKIIAQFKELLNDKIKLHLYNCNIIKSKGQEDLELLWNSGKRDLSKEVKDGLKNETLMDFKG